MPKIKIKSTLISNSNKHEWNVMAILTEDQLTYKEDSNTLITFNYKNHELTRKTSEMTMNFNFIKKNLFIEVNSLNKTMTIPLILEKIKIEQPNLLVTYFIEEEKYTYKIEVEK